MKLAKQGPPLFNDEYLGETKFMVEVAKRGQDVEWRYYSYGAKSNNWMKTSTVDNWKQLQVNLVGEHKGNDFGATMELSVSLSGLN